MIKPSDTMISINISHSTSTSTSKTNNNKTKKPCINDDKNLEIDNNKENQRNLIPWWKPKDPKEKPPYTYATLIAHAILSSSDGRLTLNQIYHWIAANYPYYTIREGGWQNSIRHNLSLNKKRFIKYDRHPSKTDPQKGCYWGLIKDAEIEFINAITKGNDHPSKQNDITLYHHHNSSTKSSYKKKYLQQQQQQQQKQKHGYALMNSTMFITLPEDYNSPTSPQQKRKNNNNKSFSSPSLSSSPIYESENITSPTPSPSSSSSSLSSIPLTTPLFTTFHSSNYYTQLDDNVSDKNLLGDMITQLEKKRKLNNVNLDDYNYCEENDHDLNVNIESYFNDHNNDTLLNTYSKRQKVISTSSTSSLSSSSSSSPLSSTSPIITFSTDFMTPLLKQDHNYQQSHDYLLPSPISPLGPTDLNCFNNNTLSIYNHHPVNEVPSFNNNNNINDNNNNHNNIHLLNHHQQLLWSFEEENNNSTVNNTAYPSPISILDKNQPPVNVYLNPSSSTTHNDSESDLNQFFHFDEL